MADSNRNKALRFALVHDWLTIPGGSEDVFREICDLFPGVAFTSQWDRNRVRFLNDREVRTSFLQRLPGALTHHYLYSPVLPQVYAGFDLREFDVVLSDSHSFAHGVRKPPGALHINYYHTPARSLWAPEVDPRATAGSFSLLRRMLAKRLRRLDLESSRNPDLIVANSHTIASRIKHAYGRDVDAVIYPPVHVDEWLTLPRGTGRLGFLYLGRLISYKRVDLAIEAATRLGVPLQIVGEGPMETTLRRQAANYPGVVFHGRLTGEHLKDVVTDCQALVFPASEDFGIVPVESMAAGLPVVAYRAGGATETVKPEYGEFFDRQNAEDLVDAMKRISRRSFDVAAMRLHARSFHADRFRAEYSNFVRSAIETWQNSRKAQ